MHLVDGENTVVVDYKLLDAGAGSEVELLLEPWVTFRYYRVEWSVCRICAGGAAWHLR